MIFREPSFYRDFRCLGGACPYTCCRDWEIVLDEEALRDYAAAPPSLRETIAGSLVTDGQGDTCFRLTRDGLCALLDADGLCAIQRRWGEEHLCTHCGAYPRFIEEYGCLTESSLAVSCPEAARLTMERGILPLREEEDARGEAPFDGVDPRLLSALTGSRARALRLLSGGERPFWGRLRALADYAADLQSYLDRGDYGALSACPLPEGPERVSAEELRGHAVRLLELLAGLPPLRPEWPETLRRRARELAALSPAGYAALARSYAAGRPHWERSLARLAQALLFRHWPKAVNDGGLYARAAFAAAACEVLYHLCLMAWREGPDFSDADERLLWARFSREVEHDEDNLFAFLNFLENPLDNAGLLL